MNRVFCTHCPSECDVNWSKDLLIKPPVCLLATTPHRWRIDYYSNIRGNSFVMSKGWMPTWNKLCLVRETYGAPISQYWSTSSHRRPGSGLASGHIWELISILSNTHTVASKLIFGKWQELELLPQCFCHLRWFVKEIERLWRQWSLSTTPHVNPYQVQIRSHPF